MNRIDYWRRQPTRVNRAPDFGPQPFENSCDFSMIEQMAQMVQVMQQTEQMVKMPIPLSMET